MSTLFNFWKKSAASRPYLTILLTEIVLSSSGDLIAQTLEINNVFGTPKHQNPSTETSPPAHTEYDFNRTLRFAFCASLLSPLGVRWHRFLDSRFPFTLNLKTVHSASPPNLSSKVSILLQRASAWSPVAKRLFCDQLLFEPILYLSLFSGLGLLEGLNRFEIKDKLTNVAFPAYVTGLALYPFVQAVNFSFVPLIYRVPFSSSFDIFWDSYLSFSNSASMTQIKQQNQ
ncbi:hypothetical protein BB560_005366 [Smittium megazygosporum]|uniref:Uncharacterized protein n=1 Tax=Smittium megazygosporum TaxID=133381 RepID=A0A2T9Z6M7_9FUNG|nr:hypothetical protein BB560_005366 [Smittium megazygosporum]